VGTRGSVPGKALPENPENSGGEGGIRTPGTGFSQYNGLAKQGTSLSRCDNFGHYYIPQAVTTLGS
jgi:hypothetical protein